MRTEDLIQAMAADRERPAAASARAAGALGRRSRWPRLPAASGRPARPRRRADAAAGRGQAGLPVAMALAACGAALRLPAPARPGALAAGAGRGAGGPRPRGGGELLTLPPAAWMPALMGQSNGQCLGFISLMSLPLLAAALWALRRGASTRPGAERRAGRPLERRRGGGGLRGALHRGQPALLRASGTCSRSSASPRSARCSAPAAALVAAARFCLQNATGCAISTPLRYDNRPAVFLATVVRLLADHAKPPHTAGGTKTGELHDGQRHREVVQRHQGLRVDPARRRLQGRFRPHLALERAGITHLDDGQKVHLRPRDRPRRPSVGGKLLWRTDAPPIDSLGAGARAARFRPLPPRSGATYTSPPPPPNSFLPARTPPALTLSVSPPLAYPPPPIRPRPPLRAAAPLPPPAATPPYPSQPAPPPPPPPSPSDPDLLLRGRVLDCSANPARSRKPMRFREYPLLNTPNMVVIILRTAARGPPPSPTAPPACRRCSTGPTSTRPSAPRRWRAGSRC